MGSERILLVAPLWRDAEVICQALQAGGFAAEAYADTQALAGQIGAGAGAILVTEEALRKQSEPLRRVLDAQPVWSDLPVTLLLTRDQDASRAWIELQTILPGSNLTVLPRPVPTATLLSVMQSALRSRRRQYEIRDYLQQQEAQTEELERRVQERTTTLEQRGVELRTARDLFRALFQANPVPVAITRLEDGLFLDVNDAYLDYFDLTRAEVVGHTSRELQMWLPDPERDALVARLRATRRMRNVEMESAHKDGSTRTALVSVEVIELEGSEAAISAFVDITGQKRAQAQIRALASQLTVAEREERHRISQVLHDDLQQQLYGVMILLTLIRDAIDAPELLQDIAEMEAAMESAIETTRNLSVDLSPPILREEGLTEGIHWIATRMERQYGLHVAVRAASDEPYLLADDGRRVLVFQIVRELLFNAVKHAGVTDVAVELSRQNAGYCIQVSDEGEGFDPDQVLRGEGLPTGQGLRRARQRLQLMGGSLQVASAPGEGTRVLLCFPNDEGSESGAGSREARGDLISP
jgi:PAS domain S-box-containing protein